MRIKDGNGFTLIEVLVVIVIIGIMAAIAVPNFLSWLPNMRLKAAAEDLYSTMQKAKIEAVARNTCVSATFTTVAFPATGGGYTSFIDDGIGGGTFCNGVQDGGEVVFLSPVVMPQNASLVTANNIGGPQAVCFNGKSLVCGSQSGNIVMRNDQLRWYRVRVQAAGVVQIGMSGDGVNWN